MNECLLLTKYVASSATTNVDSSDKINALMYFTSDYEEFSISFGVKSHSSTLQKTTRISTLWHPETVRHLMYSNTASAVGWTIWLSKVTLFIEYILVNV